MGCREDKRHGLQAGINEKGFEKVKQKKTNGLRSRLRVLDRSLNSSKREREES